MNEYNIHIPVPFLDNVLHIIASVGELGNKHSTNKYAKLMTQPMLDSKPL